MPTVLECASENLYGPRQTVWGPEAELTRKDLLAREVERAPGGFFERHILRNAARGVQLGAMKHDGMTACHSQQHARVGHCDKGLLNSLINEIEPSGEGRIHGSIEAQRRSISNNGTNISFIDTIIAIFVEKKLVEFGACGEPIRAQRVRQQISGLPINRQSASPRLFFDDLA